MPAERTQGRGVFHSIVLVVFCCLSFIFFSLYRCLAFIAVFGGVPRLSVGRRLLPLWLSLCFPLRGVGWIVALRWSSLFHSSIKYA